MWSSLICIVDRSARQIGDQFYQLATMFLPFWNSAGIFTGCLEKKHSFFLLLFFSAEKKQTLRGKRKHLEIVCISVFVPISWFSFSSRIVLFCLSTCQSVVPLIGDDVY